MTPFTPQRNLLRLSTIGLVLMAACADATTVSTLADDLPVGGGGGTTTRRVTPTPAPSGLAGGVGQPTTGGNSPSPGTESSPSPGATSSPGSLPTNATARPTFAPAPTAAATTVPVGAVLATGIQLFVKDTAQPLVEPATLSVNPGEGNTPVQQGWMLEFDAVVRYTDPSRLDNRLTVTAEDLSIVTVSEVPVAGTELKSWKLVGKKPGTTRLLLRSVDPSGKDGDGIDTYIERTFEVQVSGAGQVIVVVD